MKESHAEGLATRSGPESCVGGGDCAGEALTGEGARVLRGRGRKGKFIVLRQPMRKRMQAKLNALKDELRRRMHQPIPEQGAYLRSVVSGHVRYYGVPLNGWAIGAFRKAVGRRWLRTLRRRSQKHRLPWQRMHRYIDRWLPPARVCHPYSWARFAVITQGRSPVR